MGCCVPEFQGSSILFVTEPEVLNERLIELIFTGEDVNLPVSDTE